MLSYHEYVNYQAMPQHDCSSVRPCMIKIIHKTGEQYLWMIATSAPHVKPVQQSKAAPSAFGPESEGMPSLPYVGPIETATFTSEGGTFYSFVHDFTINVPPDAVPKGKKVMLRIGSCSHGPFAIPHDCYLITGLFCVVADAKFEIPATLTMQHCLEMPQYERTSEIFVLRADFSDITESGEYLFRALKSYPAVSDSSPHVSFQLQEFCVLCAVYKPQSSRMYETQSSTESTGSLAASLVRQVAIDEPSSGGISPQTSQDDGDNHTTDCKCNRCSGGSSSILSSGEHEAVVPMEQTVLLQSRSRKQRKSSRRRYLTSYQRSGSQEKRKCRVAYTLLLFEPQDYASCSEVYIYACQDCSTSIEACEQQMQKRGSRWKQPFPLSFLFESDSITFEADRNVPAGWCIVPKATPEIAEAAIQIHHKPLEERRRLTEMDKYPPNKVFEVLAINPHQPLICRITVRGTSESPEKHFFTLTCTSSPPVMQTPVPRVPWIPQAQLSQQSLLQHLPQFPSNQLYFHMGSSQLPPQPFGVDNPTMPVSGAPDNVGAVAFAGNVESSPRTIELQRSMSNEEKECLHKHVDKNALLKINPHIVWWKRLAWSFGMDRATIARIHNDHHLEGDAECSYQMLLHWIKTNDSEPTYEKLISALEEAHETQALFFVFENLYDLASI